MQVKKFEARSMKEALDMIKREFGPEAIILSAKDNSQRYGLLGEGSVEVTAAISESSLKKKKFVETKMPDHLKENFSKSPARSQKEWVEKLVNSYRNESESQSQKKKISVQKAIQERRYIDITDEADIESVSKELLEGSQTEAPKKTPEVVQLQKELDELKALFASIKAGQSLNATNAQVLSPTANSLNLPIELISLYEKLKSSGLREEFALNLLDLAKKKIPNQKYNNRGFVEGWIVNYILEQATTLMPKNKIQLFIGPAGSGKTSLLVKWATHLLMRQKKKIAILTTDQAKIGAVQQMRLYAQILNVPFVSISKRTDWNYVIKELSAYDHLLCDFHGTSLQNEQDLNLIQALMPGYSVECDKHLVFSAMTSRQDLNRLYLNYKLLQPSSLSFTRLDETKQRGFLFEMSYLHRIPLFGFSIGPKIPDDFELATPERIVDFVLQISNSGGIDAFR